VSLNNDFICVCKPGWDGPSCNDQQVCSVDGVSSLQRYPCAGRGFIDSNTGICQCNPPFVGICCEVDPSNINCGGDNAQPFVQSDARGIKLYSDMRFKTSAPVYQPPAPPAAPTSGFFNEAYYFMNNNDAARSGLSAFQHWSTTVPVRAIWLSNGARGMFDAASYASANGVATGNALSNYISAGASKLVFVQ
jgi:hypothetical protein